MKRSYCILLAACLASVAARVQATSSPPPTITAADMFGEVGLYYMAYSNEYNPLSFQAQSYPTGDVMGAAGPDRMWDFSKGPTNVIYRFDYLAPTGIPEAEEFPQAKIVERKRDLATGAEEFLFFEQVPGVGRRVYGFYADNILFTPSNVFVPSIVDFPDQISYGQEWATSTSYRSTVSGEDPEEETGFDIAIQTTMSSRFKVDAHGIIVLPDELDTFGPGLRINEEITIEIDVDDGDGNFQHVETDYVRKFYWVMPGRGIVAQLSSVQSTSMPPDNFSRATQFWRMFETNKRAPASGGCVTAEPVADLKIRRSGGQVLLTWSKANCAQQYRIDYCEDPLDVFSWKPLSTFTNQFFLLDEAQQVGSRFYRVVSLR